MPRRNWTSIEYDENSGELNYDIRIEINKGSGTTKRLVSSIDYVNLILIDFFSYMIKCPPPHYK